MSATGKSSVIGELAARGYRAVDIDAAGWLEQAPDGHWEWQVEPVRELLATDESDVLFLSGTSARQGQFYPQFDHVILLSAPTEVIVERLANRTTNPYGKHPDELAEVLHNIEAVEPLLRRRAHHEVDTSVPLDEVVATVLRLVDE
ncbi:MAG: ATP-binding protein [Dehalococcoidia bacterium]|nr:ATP-binding protein [Dehalococcoidia bacterium]